LKSAETSEELTQKTAEDERISRLRDVFNGKVSVLLGHSGVGKSTLVNILLGTFARQTGGVNDVTGRGRHTSSNASAFELPLPRTAPSSRSAHTSHSANLPVTEKVVEHLQPGWIIDTPGVRSFGLSHVNKERVLGSFSEFASLLQRCPKNCSHNEPTCALTEIEKNGDPKALSRLESLRRILLA
jgi:ribosome biogenesis GTPase